MLMQSQSVIETQQKHQANETDNVQKIQISWPWLGTYETSFILETTQSCYPPHQLSTLHHFQQLERKRNKKKHSGLTYHYY